MNNKNDIEPDALTFKSAFCTDFYICSANFQTVLYTDDSDLLMGAKWINTDDPFELKDLTDFFSMELPECLNFTIDIESVKLQYLTKSSKISLTGAFKDFGELEIGTKLADLNREYYFKMGLDNAEIKFSDIPILGNYIKGDDGFSLLAMGVYYVPNVEFRLEMDAQLKMFGFDEKLQMRYNQVLEKDEKRSDVQLLKAISRIKESNDDEKFSDYPLFTSAKPAESIHWLDLNKKFSVLSFYRVGFSMQESDVKLYLDAGFSIAILQVDFYGLYVSFSLEDIWNFRFGLSGLMVSIDKPPMYLSGGLYKQPGEVLYNGEAILKLTKFSFVALASYGELDDGQPSFFLYCMLGTPMGGPPYFFVTGLALGFGINRSINLPDINHVRDFPFIAAVEGRSKNLDSNTKPVVALNELSDYIVPSEGNYFFTAGIRFTTFGLLQTFAIMNIEIGKKFRLSLLGISTASVPPDVGAVNPLIYAELAMEVVIDPSDGFFAVMAALTSESYLFDKSCKLTGGFAVCIWLKGDYAGDFLVTLGGCHHPKFKNKHYPEINKLGINWIISKKITVKGDAYFAITPSCIMAGGELELMFKAGGLKAWFHALASFLIQWKPFYYDIDVSVSVGVSYTVKFWGIHKTFKVELGAGLHIWGPNFSGKVHIKWWVISFTIGFGDGKAKKPAALKFDEFSDSFLPDYNENTENAAKNVSYSNSEDRKICDIVVYDGIIKEIKKDTKVIGYLVNPLNIGIKTVQCMPGTLITLNEKNIAAYDGDVGIVSMNLKKIDVQQHIIVERKTKDGWKRTDMDYKVTRENMPKALWGNASPDINDTTINDIPTGIELTARNMESEYYLLPKVGSYDMRILNQSESIDRTFIWGNPVIPDGIDYRHFEVISTIEETISDNTNRDEIMNELTDVFGTLDKVSLDSIYSNAKDVFLSIPVLKTIGSK